MDSIKTAVVVFAYDRPKHLERCLSSLENNLDAIDIKTYIYIDGPKAGNVPQIHFDVIEVASNFKNRNSNCEINVARENLGLRESIISATSTLFKVYEGLIIVEDDLILGLDFIPFMLACLNTYRADKAIASISGFAESHFPPFIRSDLIAAKRQSCWGWATWQDRWNAVSWDTHNNEESLMNIDREKLGSIGWDLKRIYDKQIQREISSWSITFDAHAARNGSRSLHPRYTLVQNSGMDGTGTHYTENLVTLRQPKMWKCYRNQRLFSYEISALFDFWLRLKHSWIQNQIDKFSSFIMLRIKPGK